MRIYIHDKRNGITFTAEVDSVTTLDELKDIIQAESGIERNRQLIIYNGMKLNNDMKTMAQYGIRDESFLELSISQSLDSSLTNSIISNNQNPSYTEAQNLINTIGNNPFLLQNLANRNPELFEAIASKDVGLVASVIQLQKESLLKSQFHEIQDFRNIQNNPENVENQRKIEQMIKNQQIGENLFYAQEENPELFIPVSMLYINISINKVKLVAFVDSGAQSTIMSIKCADKCGLTKLMDKRFQGIAKGVGTARIIGRIHAAPVEIGGTFFTFSFTIMDQSSIGADVLFGLDNLKRLQCMIDLVHNQLHILNGQVKVKFLNEIEIQNNPNLSIMGFE